ncbi:MAG: phosphate acyltransferase [Nanoarchaeota archaeon]
MIKIGFSDNNSDIMYVKERIEKENIFKLIIYDSVESALKALISKEIDCLVGGHDISTSDYLKIIFQLIKPKNRVYSYSVLRKNDSMYFFADTAVNISLSEEQKKELNDLLQKEVGNIFELKITNLSFKTDEKGMQVDAALLPEIALKKGIKNSIKHNSFIFPDLNSANISYKLVQRLGDYEHIGPILLGTGYHISDLSRGASKEEIYSTAIYLANLVSKENDKFKKRSNSSDSMDIRYVEKKPTLVEFNQLRDSVDWNLAERGISNESAQKSLDVAPYCVCAYSGNKIIGMVRMSGDQGMYGYIQDTIVLPEFQGKGVGRKLMQIILKNIQNKKGYLLGTCPSKVAVEFYSSFGFKKRPENPNGFMFMEIGKDQLKI